MATRKLTERHQLACYVLANEFDRSQTQIATLFDVRQSTVSNAIKEATYKIELNQLQQQLDEVRAELRQNLMLESPAPLIPQGEIIDVE